MPINFNAQGTANNMGLLGPGAPAAKPVEEDFYPQLADGNGYGPLGQTSPAQTQSPMASQTQAISAARSMPSNIGPRPEPGWLQILGASLGGPAGVERLYQNTEAPWRGNVAQYISRELLEGRPAWKPLHPMEVHGLIQKIDPKLNSDPQFQPRMKYWMDSWNRSAMATQTKMLQAEGLVADRAKTYGGNIAKFGGEVDPGMVPAMKGYGYGGLLGPAPNAVATETAYPTARSQYYVQPESRRTALADTAKERMLGPVRTANQVAQRKALNQVPTAQWMEQTNPDTGGKKKAWSGGLLDMDLGRSPQTMAEMGADKVRESLATGQKPASGTVAADIYNRAVNPNTNLLMMQGAMDKFPGMFKLGNGGAQPQPKASPAPNVAPQSASNSNSKSRVQVTGPQAGGQGGQKNVPYSRVKETAKIDGLSEGEVIRRIQNAGYSIDWSK
ncbi:MAG: hypothetical protein KKE29_12865 [Proteobacteria bacterium]|nr:hypothetical protein [Pseudomonadota bacterium]MBU4599075.1 hypothetical protein [Pseudomonadota bacterium]MBV1714872.1 hypothetical protein [Desulfarculus sp.]